MSLSRLGNSKSNGGLGYRDMEVFNLALLANQGWRLIQDPNFLLGTILREKYYPGKTFQQAALGHNLSFAWRSILKARPTLENGLVWRIGNGEKIKNWGDKWVLNSPDFLVHSPPNGLNNEDRVCSLLDQQTGWWKNNVLGEYFDPVEAERISNLVPSPLLQEDCLIWRGTKNGFFYVRSAYFLELERRQQDKVLGK